MGFFNWLGYVLLALLTGEYVRLRRSSGVKTLRKLRGERAQERIHNNTLSKENLSLSMRNAFLATELQKLGPALQSLRDGYNELSKANDTLRKQVARQRMDLDYEKRRADGYYQRVLQLQAEYGQLDLDNPENITG